jgi:hypothetical protein
MKKKIIVSISIAVLLLSVYLIFFHNMISSDFATEVYIRVWENDRSVSLVKVTDQVDLEELKDILRGRANRSSPSCGFSDNIAIIMQCDEKKIVFSPARDGCPIVRIGGTNRFILISEEQRDTLNRIFEKHGIIFPHT